MEPSLGRTLRLQRPLASATRLGGILFAVLGFLLLVTSCGSPPERPKSERCAHDELRCDDVCVSVVDDRENCGACGKHCDIHQLCMDRRCVNACAVGSALCDDVCTDIQNDPAHCGGCDAACPEGHSCSEGVCVPGLCEAGLTHCVGGCVDLESDRTNCGQCGLHCRDGEICVEGSCTPNPCEAEEEYCAGSCVDLGNDAVHCGACGNSCDVGEVCRGGSCVCDEGLQRCGSHCVDVQNDDAHCGRCDFACAELAQASGSFCSEGSCVLGCDSGFASCDGNWRSGCETNTQVSIPNCGACDLDCRELDGVLAATCVAGQCAITNCEPGLANCDEYSLNGCEVRLDSNADHCGRCGFACGALDNVINARCSESTCHYDCAEGWEDCDGESDNGCEIFVLGDDDENCGACGNTCEVHEVCVDGACSTDEEWAYWPAPPDAPDDYDLSIPGIVYDNITELYWERNPPGPEAGDGRFKTHEEATAYCRDLRLGGYDDWRLPTMIQLVSIVDHTKFQATAINEEAFPDTENFAYWTRTRYVSGSLEGWWTVQFASGLAGYGQSEQNLVRCVRGGKSSPGFRYAAGTGYVTDLKTGLVWSLLAPAGFRGANQIPGNCRTDQHGNPLPSNETMTSYCAELRVGGWSDWRVPTIKELVSIYDVRRTDPALNTLAFRSNVGNGTTWSSSIRNGSSWSVDFFPRSTLTVHTTSGCGYVRCVRDADPE